ncbi:hypothetical protein IAD21_02995 [Abditibacteriota bacterium]|nr:hypothetical protein IAD21_02995 [Abditibacteriota bacterium]
MSKNASRNTALNGICPYFTMFPLDFPYSILSRHASEGQWVIDPFCGRGTTNYASRLLGLPSIGIDSSGVAAALTEAKLANTSPQSILRAAQRILEEVGTPCHVPTGEFWEWAYHPDVLNVLCRLREGLLSDCNSDSRKALRAILMGALHGPLGKTKQSYFSNQCPRTYAPKPSYSVRFWKARDLNPNRVDVLRIITDRAIRYYAKEPKNAVGRIICGDSRSRTLYSRRKIRSPISWVITSPPYYGMNTYISDQWLRQWFVGGQSIVDYSNQEQMQHSSPEYFALQLKQVWQNVGSICVPDARLVIRFGGINERKNDSLPILKNSLKDSGWRIQTIKSAGTASKGYRQADHFTKAEAAREEHDIWATWKG